MNLCWLVLHLMADQHFEQKNFFLTSTDSRSSGEL